MENTGETRKLQASIARLESLGAARAQLYAYVEEDLKKLDKARREEKTRLGNILAGLKDCILAVQVANILAPTEPGADDSRRNRLSKRRSVLRSLLKASYPHYDFTVSKGRSGGQIVAEYIGDEDTREAIDLIASLERAREYLSLIHI